MLEPYDTEFTTAVLAVLYGCLHMLVMECGGASAKPMGSRNTLCHRYPCQCTPPAGYHLCRWQVRLGDGAPARCCLGLRLEGMAWLAQCWLQQQKAVLQQMHSARRICDHAVPPSLQST